MSLRLEIVSRQRQSLGERGLKEFGPTGGTIGRSLESDWVLPDGQRFLSSRHASIDFRSGSYYVIDTSTNGVYINGADQPVGRGKPQRLFSGDRLRIGDYEMMVEIDDLENTRETLADHSHVDPVDAAQHVEAPDPTGADLVDAFEITGVGIEHVLEEDEADTLSPLSYKFRSDDLELEPEAPAAKPKGRAKARSGSSKPSAPTFTYQGQTATRPGTAPAKTQTPQAGAAERRAAAKAKRPPSRAQAPAGKAVSGGGSALGLDELLKGAGLDPKGLDESEAQQTLQRLGQLMRELIVGVTESLQVRSLQKARLRQSNTTIQPSDNNVLKFSAGVEEAFENLIFRESEQYMGAIDSVRGAFRDLNVHQRAMIDAMQRALVGYLERFDPDQLEEKFSNGKRGSLMGAASKLKYWDLYRDVYLVLSQHSKGELPHAFVEEFARAYEQAADAGAPSPVREATTKRKAG